MMTIEQPPATLTLAQIRRYLIPLGTRTMFRMISKGEFPPADIRIGAKIRLWKRETIEAWVELRAAA